MATVINNPGTETVDTGGGWVFAVIVAVILVALFLLFGLPALNNQTDTTPNVNVPGSIDVNLEGSGSGGAGGTGGSGGVQ